MSRKSNTPKKKQTTPSKGPRQTSSSPKKTKKHMIICKKNNETNAERGDAQEPLSKLAKTMTTRSTSFKDIITAAATGCESSSSKPRTVNFSDVIICRYDVANNSSKKDDGGIVESTIDDFEANRPSPRPLEQFRIIHKVCYDTTPRPLCAPPQLPTAAQARMQWQIQID